MKTELYEILPDRKWTIHRMTSPEGPHFGMFIYTVGTGKYFGQPTGYKPKAARRFFGRREYCEIALRKMGITDFAYDATCILSPSEFSRS